MLIGAVVEWSIWMGKECRSLPQRDFKSQARPRSNCLCILVFGFLDEVQNKKVADSVLNVIGDFVLDSMHVFCLRIFQLEQRLLFILAKGFDDSNRQYVFHK